MFSNVFDETLLPYSPLFPYHVFFFPKYIPKGQGNGSSGRAYTLHV